MIVVFVVSIGIAFALPLLLFAVVISALYALFSDTSFLDALNQAMGGMADGGSSGP